MIWYNAALGYCCLQICPGYKKVTLEKGSVVNGNGEKAGKDRQLELSDILSSVFAFKNAHGQNKLTQKPLFNICVGGQTQMAHLPGPGWRKRCVLNSHCSGLRLGDVRGSVISSDTCRNALQIQTPGTLQSQEVKHHPAFSG